MEERVRENKGVGPGRQRVLKGAGREDEGE